MTREDKVKRLVVTDKLIINSSTSSATAHTSGSQTGYIAVVVNGTTLYIPCYPTHD